MNTTRLNHSNHRDRGVTCRQAVCAYLPRAERRWRGRWRFPSRWTRRAKRYRRGVANNDAEAEANPWIIHEERIVDDTRKAKLSIARVELPDGVRFEQYVLRVPKAAMTVVVDDAGERVLMMWRHRFVIDRWVWELPGGYVDQDEDPSAAAAREVEEETGWRPTAMEPLMSFQPMVGTADAENLLFYSHGAVHTGQDADINEATRVAWVELSSVPARIAQGEIVGAASIIGLLAVLSRVQAGRQP
jgi:8-oxo-dGDP phosphatase